MLDVRVTQNAVAGFRRALCPESSPSGAYRALRRACRRAQYSERPPRWLRVHRDNDGYLLLDEGHVALPLRRGRAVACLADPGAEVPGRSVARSWHAVSDAGDARTA